MTEGNLTWTVERSTERMGVFPLMITHAEMGYQDTRATTVTSPIAVYADLPPGPCGRIRPNAALSDLYKVANFGWTTAAIWATSCDIMADDATNKAERRQAEDRRSSAVNEALVFWDKVRADADLEDERSVWRRSGPRPLSPWEALKLRERNVKDRESGRRENRQDAYDADDGQAATVEPDWDTFATP